MRPPPSTMRFLQPVHYINSAPRLSKFAFDDIIHHMKIAILGFDREGGAALRFVQRTPEYAGAEIWILDRNKNIEVPAGLHARLGDDYLSSGGLEEFDVVFRTPGARYHTPEIQRAIGRGVNVTSGTKEFFARCPGRIVGVTGTKGKGTTTTLAYEILRAGGKKAFIAGNIGKPALDILPELDADSWAVLELSSFQLIDLAQSPHIAVALMITAEHLDWHKDIEEYVEAKSNIVRHQAPGDFAVLAEDYPRTIPFRAKTRGEVFTFSRNHPVERGTWVENDAFWFSDGMAQQKVCGVEALHIPGRHNWENASAAITVGKIAGVGNGDIARAVEAFRGLEHRLEFVAEIGGVRYYNDSYSTTPEAAQVAIEAFPDSPKIVILGGSSKNSDFGTLGETIGRNADGIRAIVGIGMEWPRIKAMIHEPSELHIIEGCATMRDIVAAAHGMARPGDVVILSPACASFDMFKSYTDRGGQFKEEVRKLK
jgi:UDP-N-acetylmuramoylalanine--D-glutamate ligase